MNGLGWLLFPGLAMTQPVPLLHVPLVGRAQGNDLLVPPKKLDLQEQSCQAGVRFPCLRKKRANLYGSVHTPLSDSECLIGEDSETQVPKALPGYSAPCQIPRGLIP